MKKLIIAAFLLGLMSCDKEQEPTEPQKPTTSSFCKCSYVVSKTLLGDGTFKYVLANNCSKNQRVHYADTNTNYGFCFDEAW